MNNKGKTILILGNGFDLAHSLPTRYADFLKFCQMTMKIWDIDYQGFSDFSFFQENYIDKWEIDESIRLSIKEAFINRRIIKERLTTSNSTLNEIHDLLNENIWYRYFSLILRNKTIKGENWIDFESEIRFVIEKIDRMSLSLMDSWKKIKNDDPKIKFFCNLLGDKFNIGKKITIRTLRETAFIDLENLTRALELYLSVFVENITVTKKIPEIGSLNPDYVINFNYTNTYERLHNKGTVYHIHGKAEADRLAADNNMVLGIDEYWSKNEQSERTDFVIFKKFAQRIQKHTGNESYKYLNEIRELFKAESEESSWTGSVNTSKYQPDGISYVYVFGHSLDITDKDILSSFIGDEATAVTVYCYDKGTEGELIANTIKLIGEETLINKANSLPQKLNYIIQKSVSCMDCKSEYAPV